MKLLKRFSLAAFAVFSLLVFAACSDVKNPFDNGDGTDGDNNNDELPTTGVYTVANALTAFNQGGKDDVAVEGYIVGVYNSDSKVGEFTDDTTIASNILLADAADEEDATNCLIVQLVYQTEVRDSLNLKTNPGNYRRKVKVTGDITAYYSVAGLKNPTAYEFLSAPNEGGAVVVIPEEVQNIAEVKKGGARVVGTVIASNTSSILVKDETGAMLVYLGEGKGVDYSAGDVVEVAGKVTKYANMLQFGEDATVEKVGTAEVVHPEPQVLTGAEMDELIAAPVIKYVEYTGVYEASGKYHNITVEGAANALGSIQYPAADLFTANTGDVIKVTGYLVGADYNKYFYTMAVKVEIVEAAPEAPDSGDNETDDGGDVVEKAVLSVADALAVYNAGEKIAASVRGYIVGAVNGTSKPKENAEFKAEVTKTTNLLLADSPEETDADKCLVVQLPSGDVRTGLAVAENYKRMVTITGGSIEKYFGVAGLKNPTGYKFEE